VSAVLHRTMTREPLAPQFIQQVVQDPPPIAKEMT
jgi:hypothetical protein